MYLADHKTKEAILNKFKITNTASYAPCTPKLLRDLNLKLAPHTDDTINGDDLENVKQIARYLLENQEQHVAHFQLYCPIDSTYSHLGLKILNMI